MNDLLRKANMWQKCTFCEVQKVLQGKEIRLPKNGKKLTK